VYGFTEEQFFTALIEAGVDLFCDVRARRGLRGSTYAFANSKRLQQRLEALGIRYVHAKDLAPSEATRTAQHEADARAGIAKRTRTELGPAFVESYAEERLSDFDSRRFLGDVAPGATALVLFCVEQQPRACHRSLLADRIAEQLGLKVEHITP
jgi:uncharacterized protein (DUF488 family)